MRFLREKRTSISVTVAAVPITTWLMSWHRTSIFCSVPRISSKGLVGNFDFPDEDSFDMDVTVTLVRSHSKKVLIPPDTYLRFVDQAAAFDYIEYGSYDTYELSLRIVRLPISDSTYECIATNLPRNEFPPERIKSIYHSRWGIESSFRKLKYTIGLSNFHAYKPEYIKQEIWAKLIAYNITEQ